MLWTHGVFSSRIGSTGSIVRTVGGGEGEVLEKIGEVRVAACQRYCHPEGKSDKKWQVQSSAHLQEFHGAFFKELGLLGRSLSKAGGHPTSFPGSKLWTSRQCVLIDNSPVSVVCNTENSAQSLAMLQAQRTPTPSKLKMLGLDSQLVR